MSENKDHVMVDGLLVDKLEQDVALAWATVEHWLENWKDPKNAYIYGDKCAYCREYMKHDDDKAKAYCSGCPVQARSGKPGCHGTPWHDIDEHSLLYSESHPEYQEVFAAIEKEYVYLVEIALDLTHRYQAREEIA